MSMSSAKRQQFQALKALPSAAAPPANFVATKVMPGMPMFSKIYGVAQCAEKVAWMMFALLIVQDGPVKNSLVKQ